MNIARILITTFVSTSAMTAWSYFKSRKEREQFREPVLLGEIISNLTTNQSVKRNSKIEGWTLHYLVGLFFVCCYDKIWNEKKANASAGSGILLGGISGLIGMAVWKQAFKLHPYPQTLDKQGYYQQLLTAHLIFGLLASMGYKLKI